MKMRKKLAAVLAAAMIVSVMPMTAFAASTNRVDKTVKVKEEITGAYPQLKIELKDTLVAGQRFYVTLENAKWKKAEMTTSTTSGAAYVYGSIGDKELEVVVNTTMNKNDVITIDLKAKDIKGEATVEVVPNDTVVPAGKYVFAVSDDTKAKAQVADPKVFADKGEVAKITFEESYIGAFTNTKATAQKVTIQLNDSNFEFIKNADDNYGSLKGKRAYSAVDITATLKDAQTLEFTIPADTPSATQRGILELVGLNVKALNKATVGNVEAYVEGYFLSDETVVVAKYGDYSTSLVTKEVEDFTAGQEKTVKFTLSEVAKGAINKDRSTTFTLSEDIEVAGVKINGDDLILADIRDADDKNIFVIDNFNTNTGRSHSLNSDNEAKFEVKVKIPSKFKGELSVKAEGRSLEETKEVQLAEVTAPVTVEVEAMKVAAGTRGNTGGKITITETAKKNIKRGVLVIQLPKDLKKDGVDFKNVKDLVIKTTGGIKVGDARWVTTSGIEIDVTRQSSEIGSIEVTGFEVNATRIIADGAYEIEVGGSAISEITDLTLNAAKDAYKNIDAITSADFILVGNAYPNAEVVFNIGSSKFTVNGKEMEMDAAAYISQGRTMVPLRYLSYALGIDTESIKFNSGIVTIFGQDNKIIQVKNGDKNLVVNGMTIPMTAAAEIVEGRTYVPVTEIGGIFGVTGTWDAVAQTATFK